MMTINTLSRSIVRSLSCIRAGMLLTTMLVVAAAGAQPAAVTGTPQLLPTTTLSAGMRNIVAMVASTPEQREIGLMFRQSMAAHEGMIFVFEEPAEQCFWMRNTLIPLSIAFLGDDGTVVNVAEMKPMTLDQHCSARPVRYVLEMNQGWFTRNGVKPGARLSGKIFQQPH